MVINNMEKLIFIVIGFILGQLPGWFDRKRKIRTYFAALRAETHVIKEKSERYLKDNVISPLFRLPTESFKTSYPILLVEGVLKEKEIHDLSLFYSQVQDINRGFDNTAAALASKYDELLVGESARCRLKVEKLIVGEEALYINVEKIINDKLDKSFWWF